MEVKMVSNLRILLIHPHLHLFGGSEKLTWTLINELSNLGHEIVVLSGGGLPTHISLPQKVKYEAIRDVFTKIPSDIILPIKSEKVLNIIYSVDDVVSKYKPDVCLVMIQEPIYVVATKLADPRIGTSLYIHFPFEEELTSNNIYVFLTLYRFPHLYESMYRLADLHITNSNYTASALYKSFGIESNVVYPAIDWNFFKDEINLNEDRNNVILTVGRFVPQKRQDVLLDWFKRYIKPEIPNAELFIVGVPDMRFLEYYERLKKLSAEVEGVTIIDKVLTPDEILKYYQIAKIYVHLRIGEHFGMAPVEAMSQGAIPILPEQSGLAEIVTNGRDGFVAANDDEFLKYILKPLRMPKKELCEIKRFAYRRAWYFNPDRLAKEVLHYLRIISKR
ncbi:MAG: glycosyltransferase family 4 protein [Sulfolobales archaeon]